MMRILAMAVLLVTSGIGAKAGPLSEVELRAAYCLAVATSQEAKRQDELTRASEEGTRETLTLAIRIARERKAKFKDFLAAKGVTAGSDAPRIDAAQERGSQDVETCERDVKVPPYKTCSDKCMSRLQAADQRLICLTACPSPDACRRIKKCLENFLPP